MYTNTKSLSSRRAWIEIYLHTCSCSCPQRVALLAESVDWNRTGNANNNTNIVALLAESVDWNHIMNYQKYYKVGRSPRGERGLKFDELNTDTDSKKSLSSRRAWIEIKVNDKLKGFIKSLSSRRAWIEICFNALTGIYLTSLSSRRAWIEIQSSKIK